jgi:predicted nucleotidyltransferase
MVRNAMERRGRSAADARRAAKQAAVLLARDPSVRLVYLFGSAADPSQTIVRDLDLGILTEPPKSLDDLMRRRADLVAATRLPVDLVSLNEASVTLAHEVVEHGTCLYANPPEEETEFVTRTRARYWDFKPFLDEQWRLAGERLKERRGGS